MKRAKMLTILVLASGLMVWPAPVAEGAQYLTVNCEPLDSIVLELGQSCTVEVISDDGRSYTDYVGFDNGVVPGGFSHHQTTRQAGDRAKVTEYSEATFYGYCVVAEGSALGRPQPGVHFVFEYEAQQVGQSDVRLYDKTLTSVMDSVQITVIPRPMGTVWTYQGRLIDDNDVAEGLYDFEFRLYRAPNGGMQEGNTIDVNDLNVIDGYFTAELDFGSDAFNGDARWLEISIRPGDSNDPGAFVTLSPRQEVTPTPYALYAKTTSEIEGGIGIDGSGTADYVAKFTGPNTIGSSLIRESAGNVGVGMVSPSTKLDVNGDINASSAYKIAGDTVLSATSTNTHVGVSAGENNTAGSGTFVGYNCGYNNQGYYNTFLGHTAGYSNTAGHENTFLGYGSGYSNTGEAGELLLSSFNTFVGFRAGYFNTTGLANTFLGHDAGAGNTTAFENTFVGQAAGYDNTEGNNNTFLGFWAGHSNRTGDNNTFLGNTAGFSNATGNGNVFIGYRAGYNVVDADNKLYIANGPEDSNTLIYGDFCTGNVGIGTTEPGAAFHVISPGVNGIRLESDDSTSRANLRTRTGAWQYLEISADNPSTASHIPIVLNPSGGNVGMGTTSPDYKLHVDGGTESYIARFESSSIGRDAYITFGNPSATEASAVSMGAKGTDLRLNTDGSSRIAIKEDGNVGVGTADPGEFKLYVNGTAYSTGGWSSSDRQFKENIETIDSALDKILSIKGVSFEWRRSEYKEKGFPDGRHFGVIAQDIEEVLPEIVKEGPDGDKAVSYTELVPILTEAIKQQQEQIENLQYEVRTLKEIMRKHTLPVTKEVQ